MLYPAIQGPAIGTPSPTPSLIKTAYWKLDDNLPAPSPPGVGNTMLDATGRGNNILRYLLPAASTLNFAIGGNEAGAQLTNGIVGPSGIWHRILTAGEKSALNGGEIWPFNTTTTLRDAKAYYLLNEAGGSTSYADATGRGNTLTKQGTNATVRVAGPPGITFATQFDGTNYLSRAVTADLQGGNQAFTIATWINLATLGTTDQVQAWWGQFNNGIRVGSVVYYHFDNAAFQLDLGNDVDLYRNAGVVNKAFGTPSINTWYFILSQYDPTANLSSQTINNVSTNSLGPIQQPAQAAGKIGTNPLGAKFQVNPDFRALNASGWDLVGAAVNCNKATNGDMSIGNAAKTVWGWVKFDDFTTTSTVMGCVNLSGTVLDWCIQQSAGALLFLTGDSAGHFDSVTVPLADNNWHMFVCWFDKYGDGKIHLNLDNGAHVATPTIPTHTPATGSVAFVMGAATNTSTGSGFDQQLAGTLDGVGIANGTPTPNDIAALWNNGAGTDNYP